MATHEITYDTADNAARALNTMKWYNRDGKFSRKGTTAMFDMPDSRPLHDHVSGHPHHALQFCEFVSRCRVPELEPTILCDPGVAARYAKSVLKSTWPEAEDRIFSSIHAITYYIEIPGVDVDRCKAAVIAEVNRGSESNYWNAYNYWAIISRIKQAWPEVEPVLKLNPSIWAQYQRLLPTWNSDA